MSVDLGHETGVEESARGQEPVLRERLDKAVQIAVGEARVAGDRRDPVLHGVVEVMLATDDPWNRGFLRRVAAVRCYPGVTTSDKHLARVLGGGELALLEDETHEYALDIRDSEYNGLTGWLGPRDEAYRLQQVANLAIERFAATGSA